MELQEIKLQYEKYTYIFKYSMKNTPKAHMSKWKIHIKLTGQYENTPKTDRSIWKYTLNSQVNMKLHLKLTDQYENTP